MLSVQDDISLKEMAVCFVEEFLRDGWSDAQLRAMFRTPSYRGPHLVWRQKGDAYIDAILQEVRQSWRPKAVGGSGDV